MVAIALNVVGWAVALFGAAILLISTRPLLSYRRRFRRMGESVNANWRMEIVVWGGGLFLLSVGLGLVVLMMR
jgi:hypothetical protein